MSAGTIDLPAEGTARPATRPLSTMDTVPLNPVDGLRERMAVVCRSAVDMLEIAAALESEGIGDQAARARYGFADVFSLAEHLYYTVARQPAEPPAEAPRWQAHWREHVLHGLLFALPALCFPVAVPLLGGTATLAAYVSATLASWALSQALAYLGFVRAGRLDHAGSMWILRTGTTVALLALWVPLFAATFLSPARVGGLIFAGGQGTYLIAATVLLVCGRHLWLLLCLAPGVTASAIYLALGQSDFTRVVWCALGTTILATLGCVVACTAHPGVTHIRLPQKYELRGAASYALFGIAAAGLLSYPVVAAQLTGSQSELAALLATPLCLSMGAAEWSLFWYRRRTDRLLRSIRDPRTFALAARRVLLATTTRYLAAAALLIAVTAGIVAAANRRPPRWMTLLECVAFLALGGALFIALLLQAFGADLVIPLACLAAAGVELTMTAATHVDPLAAQLLACTALSAALLIHAAKVLSRPTQHA